MNAYVGSKSTEEEDVENRDYQKRPDRRNMRPGTGLELMKKNPETIDIIVLELYSAMLCGLLLI